MTVKVQILETLRRLFIILVGLTMTLFYDKMLISHICIGGLMPNLTKKSWTVSKQWCVMSPAAWAGFFLFLSEGNQEKLLVVVDRLIALLLFNFC